MGGEELSKEDHQDHEEEKTPIISEMIGSISPFSADSPATTNPSGTVDPTDVAHLEFRNYNVPQGDGVNLLGQVLGYWTEKIYIYIFCSVPGVPNNPVSLLWVEVSRKWLKLAASLEGMELERSVDWSFCLRENPKSAVGLSGSTSNIFMGQCSLKGFSFRNFQARLMKDLYFSQILRVNMRSWASDALSRASFLENFLQFLLAKEPNASSCTLLVQTCLPNGFPSLVICGMSDLAGRQSGENRIDKFGSLAALNTAKSVLKFISKLPVKGVARL
ncbi:hypothetical protein Tsubulata_037558 [Turnera subulata]|uniref:Uncharacterized protein n=1 Tax=Turnera subulata TaxID=218843 RepID=A0A9Q0J6L4_9ROSI|nr:hypothetical protein Tsubulata_037558 [Turnera subulata]